MIRSGASRGVCLGVAVLWLGACGGNDRPKLAGSREPDKLLFEFGTKALDEHHWLRARESFRQLVDTYPQSPYRPDAKLGIGDTYYRDGGAENYVLAVAEYREFLSFYPTHPRADYAQFQIGMCHFKQMLGSDRDQTETREAIKELETFLQRSPTSSLAAEGRQRLREAEDRFGRYNYGVGFFYYRQGAYLGAIDRFKALLKDDPQYTNRDAVYFYLAESLRKSDKKAEALPYYQRLVDEFVQSEYLAEAKRWIDELQKALAPK